MVCFHKKASKQNESFLLTIKSAIGYLVIKRQTRKFGELNENARTEQ